jgi:hypothetical protein
MDTNGARYSPAEPAADDPTAAAVRPSRARGGLLLASIGALVVLLLIGLVAFILGIGRTPATSAPPAPSAPAVLDPQGWDLAAETELATRPMSALPEAAALPHPLSTHPPTTSLVLPPGGGRNAVLAERFPPTSQGALAQLAELTRVGLQGADPKAYALAYASVAAPGAPAVESTVMHRGLTDIRSKAGLAREGAVLGLSMTFTPLGGLIKGSTDGGRYVVACVLGQLDVTANGTPISTGGADCQAMRWVEGNWRISPGAQAAAAPIAWPGTDDAFVAGYLPVRGS